MKTEERIVAKFQKAEAAYHVAMKEADEFYSPLIKQALEKNDETEALNLIRRCPCIITRAFGFDKLRQWQAKQNKPTT